MSNSVPTVELYKQKYQEHFKQEKSKTAAREFYKASVEAAIDNFEQAKKGCFKSLRDVKQIPAKLVITSLLVEILEVKPDIFSTEDANKFETALRDILAHRFAEQEESLEWKCVAAKFFLGRGKTTDAKKVAGDLVTNDLFSIIVHLHMITANPRKYEEIYGDNKERLIEALRASPQDKLRKKDLFAFANLCESTSKFEQSFEIANFVRTNRVPPELVELFDSGNLQALASLLFPNKDDMESMNFFGEQMLTLVECSHLIARNHLEAKRFNEAEQTLNNSFIFCESPILAYEPQIKRKTLELLYTTKSVKHSTLTGNESKENLKEMKACLGKLIHDFKETKWNEQLNKLIDEEKQSEENSAA